MARSVTSLGVMLSVWIVALLATVAVAQTTARAGATTAHAGATTAHAGATTAHAGATTAHAGATTAHAGATTAHAGATTAHAGATTAHAGATTAHAGVTTAHAGATTTAASAHNATGHAGQNTTTSTTKTSSATQAGTTLGTMQIAATTTCPALTAVDANISQIQGLWYVQAYNPPTGGNLITRCDTFNITVSGSTGQIVYTFLQTGESSLSKETATIQAVPRVGQYIYHIESSTMMTTILVFRLNDAYVHLACPQDNQIKTLVVSTKVRNPADSEVTELLSTAASHGAPPLEVKRVDQTNCP